MEIMDDKLVFTWDEISKNVETDEILPLVVKDKQRMIKFARDNPEFVLNAMNEFFKSAYVNKAEAWLEGLSTQTMKESPKGKKR